MKRLTRFLVVTQIPVLLSLVNFVSSLPVSEDDSRNKTVCAFKGLTYQDKEDIFHSNPCLDCFCDAPYISCTTIECTPKVGCPFILPPGSCCPVYSCPAEVTEANTETSTTMSTTTQSVEDVTSETTTTTTTTTDEEASSVAEKNEENEKEDVVGVNESQLEEKNEIKLQQKVERNPIPGTMNVENRTNYVVKGDKIIIEFIKDEEFTTEEASRIEPTKIETSNATETPTESEGQESTTMKFATTEPQRKSTQFETTVITQESTTDETGSTVQEESSSTTEQVTGLPEVTTEDENEADNKENEVTNNTESVEKSTTTKNSEESVTMMNEVTTEADEATDEVTEAHNSTTSIEDEITEAVTQKSTEAVPEQTKLTTFSSEDNSTVMETEEPTTSNPEVTEEGLETEDGVTTKMESTSAEIASTEKSASVQVTDENISAVENISESTAVGNESNSTLEDSTMTEQESSNSSFSETSASENSTKNENISELTTKMENVELSPNINESTKEPAATDQMEQTEAAVEVNVRSQHLNVTEAREESVQEHLFSEDNATTVDNKNNAELTTMEKENGGNETEKLDSTTETREDTNTLMNGSTYENVTYQSIEPVENGENLIVEQVKNPNENGVNETEQIFNESHKSESEQSVEDLTHKEQDLNVVQQRNGTSSGVHESYENRNESNLNGYQAHDAIQHRNDSTNTAAEQVENAERDDIKLDGGWWMENTTHENTVEDMFVILLHTGYDEANASTSIKSSEVDYAQVINNTGTTYEMKIEDESDDNGTVRFRDAGQSVANNAKNESDESSSQISDDEKKIDAENETSYNNASGTTVGELKNDGERLAAEDAEEKIQFEDNSTVQDNATQPESGENVTNEGIPDAFRTNTALNESESLSYKEYITMMRERQNVTSQPEIKENEVMENVTGPGHFPDQLPKENITFIGDIGEEDDSERQINAQKESTVDDDSNTNGNGSVSHETVDLSHKNDGLDEDENDTVTNNRNQTENETQEEELNRSQNLTYVGDEGDDEVVRVVVISNESNNVDDVNATGNDGVHITHEVIRHVYKSELDETEQVGKDNETDPHEEQLSSKINSNNEGENGEQFSENGEPQEELVKKQYYENSIEKVDAKNDSNKSAVTFYQESTQQANNQSLNRNDSLSEEVIDVYALPDQENISEYKNSSDHQEFGNNTAEHTDVVDKDTVIEVAAIANETFLEFESQKEERPSKDDNTTVAEEISSVGPNSTDNIDSLIDVEIEKNRDEPKITDSYIQKVVDEVQNIVANAVKRENERHEEETTTTTTDIDIHPDDLLKITDDENETLENGDHHHHHHQDMVKNEPANDDVQSEDEIHDVDLKRIKGGDGFVDSASNNKQPVEVVRDDNTNTVVDNASETAVPTYKNSKIKRYDGSIYERLLDFMDLYQFGQKIDDPQEKVTDDHEDSKIHKVVVHPSANGHFQRLAALKAQARNINPKLVYIRKVRGKNAD